MEAICRLLPGKALPPCMPATMTNAVFGCVCTWEERREACWQLILHRIILVPLGQNCAPVSLLLILACLKPICLVVWIEKSLPKSFSKSLDILKLFAGTACLVTVRRQKKSCLHRVPGKCKMFSLEKASCLSLSLITFDWSHTPWKSSLKTITASQASFSGYRRAGVIVEAFLCKFPVPGCADTIFHVS